MAHCIVEAAEAIWIGVPVLDHGFVRLVDYLGSDERIVQSARVSYGAGTKSYRQDKGRSPTCSETTTLPSSR